MSISTAESIHAKRIAGIISVVIFVLAAINGIFTYSGAHLFIKEMIFAVLFDVSVGLMLLHTPRFSTLVEENTGGITPLRIASIVSR